MQSIKRVTILMVAALITVSSVSAADFSSYSTDELKAMRGTLKSASVEEREAFRQEWQSRMRNSSNAQRNTQKSQYRYRHGGSSEGQSGSGSMNMYGGGGGARQGGGHHGKQR